VSDGLVDPPGPVGAPTIFSVNNTRVEMRLSAGPTYATPSKLQEVAWAVACCPDETATTRFSSSIQITMGGDGTSGRADLTWDGSNWKVEGTLGIDLPLLGTGVIIAHDGRWAKGTGSSVATTLGQIASIRRSSQAEASVASTTRDCQSQGIYAFRRKTTYTLGITATAAGGQSQSVQLPIDVTFFSTPFLGPKQDFPGHCNQSFIHTGRVETGIGGADAGVGSAAGCARGRGCPACCETSSRGPDELSRCLQRCR